ncbi:MAG: hypothetical protein LBF22_13455 [Deltaproteobacteria bacterium]|jgi:hypothetical protein|nr:hypothetical protein [Deltaproteobacteria bacterium]
MDDLFLKQLNTLKLANFSWVKSLEDIWNLSTFDVPALHKRALGDFSLELVHLLTQESPLSPPGIIISGPGGSGKTHLLSRFCDITFQNQGYFLLADLSGVKDFLETILGGILHSLITPIPALGGLTQAAILAAKVLTQCKFKPPQDLSKRYTRHTLGTLNTDLEKILGRLAGLYPREAMEHKEALRAILLLNTLDPHLGGQVLNWVKGFPLTLEGRDMTGFSDPRGEAATLISGFSFFLSLGQKMTVLALDQLDHLASLFNILIGTQDDQTISRAKNVIANISDGLGRLPALTRRTLTIVSCLPFTWENLANFSLNSALDRYRRPPIFLSPLNSTELVAGLIHARMKVAAEKAGYLLPYPTWPFKPEAFQESLGVYPRPLLERCQKITRELVLDNEIKEITSLFEKAPSSQDVFLEEADTLEPEPLDPMEDSEPSWDTLDDSTRQKGQIPGLWENPPTPSDMQNLPSLPREHPRQAPQASLNPPPFRGISNSSERHAETLENPAILTSPNLPLATVNLAQVNQADPQEHMVFTWGKEQNLNKNLASKTPQEGPEIKELDSSTAPQILELDSRFQSLLENAPTEEFKTGDSDDKFWPQALETLAHNFTKSLANSKQVEISLEKNSKNPEFGILRLNRLGENNSILKSLSLRAILQKSAQGFLPRLEKALASTEIDPTNPRKRLLIIRFSPKPGGPQTSENISRFETSGGLWSKPSDQDIAILWAYQALQNEALPEDFAHWAEATQPWSKVLFWGESLSWLIN